MPLKRKQNFLSVLSKNLSQNPLRVCILTSAHPAFDTRIFHKEARTLVKVGYDVVVIVPHERDEEVDGVKIRAVPKQKNRIERMLLTTYRLLIKALKEKADVYHFHDPELIPVGLFLKLCGTKVIYDVHEDYPASIKKREWLPPFIRNIVADVFNIFEKIGSRFFDAVIPATEGISKRFPNSKVVILHNYPILHYVVDKVNPKLSREGYTIIYVGGLAKIRGISEIVQSLEYIDEKLRVKLKLLGQFTESDFEKEVRAIESFSKVDFVGLVPHEEVYSHLSTADIGLVLLHPTPRYVTSMPVKMFEYMLVGLPVIASNFPLWKEIIEGNNCGLTVNPMNPREIAAAIEYLLKRPELKEEMGKNGRKAVLEKYNWESEAKKLLELYDDMLDQKAARSHNLGKELTRKK